MVLRIEIRPYKIECNHKNEALRKFGLVNTFSSFGNHYSKNRDDDTIYVINYQKFRKKTKQTKKVKDGKSITTSKVIRNAHWVAYLYCIPKFWLKAEKKIVNQKSRNFAITDSTRQR